MQKILKNSAKKSLSLFLVLLMLVGTLPITAFAVETDISGHWAEKEILKWSELELFKGDGHGTYRPQDNITRAEFMALVNRMNSYTDKSEDIAKYKDVDENVWYYDVISVALAAGYIKGTGDGVMSPDASITREEAMAIVARISSISSNDYTIFESADDGAAVSSWAKSSVVACIHEGLIAGYNNKINPTANITRAEAIVLLNRIYSNIRTYAFAGTYGPTNTEDSLKVNSVIVAGSGVKLRNMDIAGNLDITESVGDGEVYLDGIKVGEQLKAAGGGQDSIYITDSTINEFIVDKDVIHIVFSDGSTVTSLVVNSEDVIIVLEDGTISEKITISASADNVQIIMSDGSRIDTLTANAPVNVTGEGEITTANIKSDGVEIENDPSNVNIDEGITVLIGGVTVSEDSGSVKRPVKAKPIVPDTFKITIAGDAEVDTDYIITGVADLDEVEDGTELTITAINDITVDGDEIVAEGTKKITIKENTTITIDKRVEEPNPTIAEIDTENAVQDIEVDFGTDENAAKALLADKIKIKDSDGQEHEVDVTWTINGYNANQAGDYDATGTFNLPAGVDNTDPAIDLRITAKVKIKEASVVENVAITAKVDGQDYVAGNELPNDVMVTVTIETATDGAEIYYTTNGDTPTAGSTLYDGAFTVNAPDAEGGTITIKAIGIKANHTNSDVATLEIKFDPAAPTYEVTFSVVGENGSLEAVVGSHVVASGNEVEEGFDINFTATPDAGYQVKEWKVNGDVVANETGNTYTLENLIAAVNVTVEFEEEPLPEKHTVTFDKNDGDTEADPKTMEVVDGKKVASLPTAPTRDGYAFEGWNTKADGSGDALTIDTEVTADITVYAVWKVIEYGIIYHLDGGTNTEDNPGGYTIETDTITLAPASKTGYSFDGWYDAETGGNKVTEITKGSTDDKALYARFTINTYTVTFKDYDGTELKSEQVEHGSDATAPAEDPTREGYKFDKWDTDFTNVTSDLTVTAEYAKVFTVSFDVTLEDVMVVVKGPAPGEDVIDSDNTNPYIYELEPGHYFYTISKDGFSEINGIVDLTEGDVVVEVTLVSVESPDKSYYVAGETLTFTISGFKANEQNIKVGMPIYIYSEENLSSDDKVLDEMGEELYLFGNGNEEGVLTVTGTVRGNLPHGALHITLPNHGYNIQNAIKLGADVGADTCLMIDEENSDFNELDGLKAGNTLTEFGLSVFIDEMNGNKANKASVKLVITDPSDEVAFNHTINIGDIEAEESKKATFDLSEVVFVEGAYKARVTLDAENQLTRTLDSRDFTVEAATYTVNFELNYPTQEPNPEAKEVKGGQEVGLLPILDDREDPEGKIFFIGWATDAQAKDTNFTAETIITEDIKVYAVWEQTVNIQNFDLIPDMDGGKVGAAAYADANEVIAVLPTSVTAHNGDITVPVTDWADTDNYDPNTEGWYTFTAVLGEPPKWVTIDENAKAIAKIKIDEAEGIKVSPLAQNYYAAGEELKFTISGLNPEETEDIEVSIQIRLEGDGYPWADQEVLEDMEKTVEDGVLTVEGKIQPGLKYGKLIIGLPEYGYPRDSGLELKDINGQPVYVGEHTVTFDVDGIPDQRVAHGGKAIKPEDPEDRQRGEGPHGPEWEYFVAWYTELPQEGQWNEEKLYNFNSPVIEPTELYARWEDYKWTFFILGEVSPEGIEIIIKEFTGENQHGPIEGLVIDDFKLSKKVNEGEGDPIEGLKLEGTDGDYTISLQEGSFDDGLYKLIFDKKRYVRGWPLFGTDQDNYFEINDYKSARKAVIRPAWEVEKVERASGNDLPAGITTDDYEITIKITYPDREKWTADDLARTVTTYFAIPEKIGPLPEEPGEEEPGEPEELGITVYYPVWEDNESTYKNARIGEIIIGKEGHLLSESNIEDDVVIYLKLDEGVTETTFRFFITLVDAKEGWGNVVYGEQELEVDLETNLP